MNDPNKSSFVFDGFDEFYYELNYSFSVNESEFIPDPATETCDVAPMSDAVTLTVCFFYFLIFLLAIPGNLIVGLVIGCSKQVLSPSDIYLFHLAVADIFLALTLPFWAISVLKGWVFGDAMCKIVSILQELSFYGSILFLVCISADRYLVIVKAMEARKSRRRPVSLAVCILVWCLGFLLALTGLYNSSVRHDTNNQTVCIELYDPNSADALRLVTRALRHTFGFIVPLAIMLTCYGVTINRLLQTRGGFQRQRAMRVIVAVVIAFLLCWTPYHLMVMVDTLFRAKVLEFKCQTRRAVDKALFATQSLGLLHSCVNPLLYAFVGEKFRNRLMQVLRKTGVVERASVTRASRSSLTSEITSTVI